ncbi:hypothetical protein E3N88_22853 [Mikania micrantha]|uniref:Uncharacterized protein n=1 Tax=Mikania micrantha TaxID=192012 RepID=A0A5N6NBN4_9ASTR|nr:hypothetical protein E3N88_22853 [Mikania micrantha]
MHTQLQIGAFMGRWPVEVRRLPGRVQKLEEIVGRNKKEWIVYDVAVRKLNETQKTLAKVEAAHASASNVVAAKKRRSDGSSFDGI